MARTATVKCAALLAMTFSASLAIAQSPPPITDTTGGVTPGATYCTNAGACFTNLPSAVTKLREETADVGQFLHRSGLGFYFDIPRIYFDVKDQPVEDELPRAYAVNNGFPQIGYCPTSIQPDNRCRDEAELIAGYIASEIQPGVTRASGWHTVITSNVRVVGSYASPYASTAGGVAREGTYYLGGNREILWDEWDIQDQVTRPRSMAIYGRGVFVCPAGMESISTDDVNVYPYLCRRINVGKFIYVHAKKLVDSCAVGTNPQPCHPSSGDKSRSETDFTFAGRPFTRFYHSLRETMPSGFRMGEGWTHSFSTTMLDPYGPRMLITSKGHWAPYFYVSAGRWRVPNLGNASLDQMPGGTWRLTEGNGDISTFSAEGQLTEVRSPGAPERDVRLEYLNGRISRVVDNAGKAAVFTYDRWNQLFQISLPDGVTYTYGYDSNENLTTVTSSAGGTKTYHYGESGLSNNSDPNLLTGITYEDGERFATFGYDVHGRVLLSTLHAAGGALTETTRLYYTGANSTQVTLPGGSVQTVTYTPDLYRKPLTITDASGTVSNTYDGYGRLLTHTDGRGAQSQYGYTGERLTSVISGAGTTVQRKVETDWDSASNLPTERRIFDSSNSMVGRTTWTYNSRGQVLTTTQTDPVSSATRTTTTTYCEQADVTAGVCPIVGLVSSSNGARTDVNDQTTFIYRASDHSGCAASPSACLYRKGDLWKATNALGHITEILAHDGAGRPKQVKDANGVITEMTYHVQGWMTSKTVMGATPAEDRSTLIDYSPTGLVKRVTQADGSYTQYGYDAAHRLTDITDSAGNTLHYTLDAAGNRTGEATRDPNGVLVRTLSRIYDQLGQLQSQSDAYSHGTGFTYDANGNTDVITDALGRAKDNGYDPLNRLAQTIQDAGGIAATTQFQYDANDNLTRVVDPKGLSTDYAYNGFGDLTQLTSPDTGVTAYTYDSAGNRASQTDARSKVQSYTYDALNRLTKITGPTRTFTYDNNNTTVCLANERFAKSRLSGFSDPSGGTKYCYNRFGDLVRKVQTTNSVVFTTRYGYDAAGRLANQTYPDGALLDAVRDGEGRIIEIGIAPSGGARQIVLTGASYAPFGPSTGWTYGNGRNVLRPLNQNYQPLAIHDAASGGLSLGFAFDAVGNLTLLQNGTQTANLAQYGYDALNRLKQSKDGPTGTPIETYAYDATGNRTSVLNAGVTTSYLYPAGSHRVDKVGTVARTYDTAGNTTKIGGTARQFVYDNSGRMTQVKAGSTVTGNYLYNAKGEQVRRYLDTTNAYFVYDGAGHLLGEYDHAGAPKQQMLWFGDMPVGVLAGAGAAQKLHYIEADHLGTPRVIIDGVRNVPIWKWSLTGEGFGNTPPNQDPDADGTAFVFDLRYPGQRYDDKTGLNYNYFRDYDPTTGRYVQSDPIGLKGGISTYGYVGANSLVSFDPFGLCSCRAVPVNGNYQGTGQTNFMPIWLGLRSKRTISCLYRCTNDSGRTDYIRAAHEELYWGSDSTRDTGMEGVCLGTTFGEPITVRSHQGGYSERTYYNETGGASFDPRKGDQRGFNSEKLLNWANQYCKDCK